MRLRYLPECADTTGVHSKAQRCMRNLGCSSTSPNLFLKMNKPRPLSAAVIPAYLAAVQVRPRRGALKAMYVAAGGDTFRQ
ncbi:hypothetical protein MRX96_019048 [Rhipicephalus microplus]